MTYLGLQLTTLSVDYNMTFDKVPYFSIYSVGLSAPTMAIATSTDFWLVTASSVIGNNTLPSACAGGAVHGPSYAFGNFYLACSNYIVAYSKTAAYVANFTTDTTVRYGFASGSGDAQLWFIASSNSTFYILNKANANNGKLIPFYQFQRYTDSDSISQFHSLNMAGDVLVANSCGMPSASR